jgi:hypothetical protein
MRSAGITQAPTPVAIVFEPDEATRQSFVNRFPRCFAAAKGDVETSGREDAVLVTLVHITPIAERKSFVSARRRRYVHRGHKGLGSLDQHWRNRLYAKPRYYLSATVTALLGHVIPAVGNPGLACWIAR